MLKKKFSKKISLINEDVNYYFLLYRVLGGFGTPSPVQNIVPIFTKIKIKNYFIMTLIGTAPLIYIWSSFGYSIKILINVNDLNFSIFQDKNILMSLIFLAIISILPVIVKRIFKK